jgi:hypothetical protein
MDTKTTFDAVFILFMLLAVFGAIGWVISTTLGNIIIWLSKRKQGQRVSMAIRQRWLSWWNRYEARYEARYKARVEELLEYLWEILINPLVFAFVVFWLFNRIISITDYTKEHPETSFFQQLNIDMENNMNVYTIALIVFTVWVFGKALIRKRQETEQTKIKKALDANTKVLEAIARQMGVPESKYKTTDTKPDAKPDTELDQ